MVQVRVMVAVLAAVIALVIAIVTVIGTLVVMIVIERKTGFLHAAPLPARTHAAGAGVRLLCGGDRAARSTSRGSGQDNPPLAGASP